MFIQNHTISDAPPININLLSAAEFARRHNAEIEVRTALLEPLFTPVLNVLRPVGRGDLVCKFSVVGVGNKPTQIVAHLRAWGRHDSFVLFVDVPRKVCWVSDLQFLAQEPQSATSQEFLAALCARIDSFVDGASMVDRYVS